MSTPSENLTLPLNRSFRLGLIINPFAGIGGALAFKGSDDPKIREDALALGAEQLAMQKTKAALTPCLELKDTMHIYTASGNMGADIASELAFKHTVVYESESPETLDRDTINCVNALLPYNIDLLLFAGGDGTARNICESIQSHVPVLGIPAGCKIHSGVYAITPKAAGLVLRQVVNGELVSLRNAEVRDIDEDKFRQGKVIAKHFGEMQVPSELSYIQAVKMGGKESDELLLDDIADYILEKMEDEPDCYYVMGSGSTVDAIMQKLRLPNTLLGVDIVHKGQLIRQDVSAEQLLALTKGRPCKLVITLIGGQGHILGRGNQQLSPEFIRQIGKENILVVASKSKIHALNGKGLIVDSSDPNLDEDMTGPMSVITGYKDHVLYFVRGH